MSGGDAEHRSYVYGLRFTKEGHRFSGLIRYVGKAFDPKTRFRRHMNPKESRGRVARSVQNNGVGAFTYEVLEVAIGSSREDADKRAAAAEIRLIAEYNTALGDHGLNLTKGGEGAVLVGEAAARKREMNRRIMREVQARPEMRAVYSAALKARWADPVKGTLMRENIRKRMVDPEFRARHKAAMDNLNARPERQAALRQQFKNIHSDPVLVRQMVERLRRYNSDPVMRQKQTAGLSKFARRPDVRAKKATVARALHQDAEFAAKYAEGLRRKHSDPVYASKHAEQTRRRHADGLFNHSAKVGIALHWARVHAANGNHKGAEKQRDTLVRLLRDVEHVDKYPIFGVAKQYLDQVGAA